MAFPQDPLSVAVELQLSGVWTDVPQDVYTRDPISITRGQQDQGSRVDSGKCSFTLNNRNGTYSPRNPLSPLYGSIGRNTPVRVSVQTGAPYLDLDGTTSGYASTPDAAALDITGDIDLRCEAEIDWYHPSLNQFIISKWGPAGTDRSYGLRIYQSFLYINWSDTGTSNLSGYYPLPLDLPPRAALRATLDVNNGASGWTATFYWAPSIAGPWTQFGTMTTAGTTSVYAGTAQLGIGGSDSTTTPPRTPPTGKVYKAEVRSGIAGTAVATPDFTIQTVGATSFTDSAGRVWTLAGTAAITNRRTRFVGEVSEWPARWDVSGKDAWVPVRASGPLRRLGQGKSPLQSAMRREFSNPARTSIVAYWPCEDGKDATELATAIPGQTAVKISGGVKPAQYTGWAASDALPTMGDGTLTGVVPAYTATGMVALRMFLNVPAAGVSTTQHLVTLTTSGSAWQWQVYLTPAGELYLTIIASDGTTVSTSSTSTVMALNGDQSSFGVELIQVGADVTWRLISFDIAALTLAAGGTGSLWTATTPGQTLGRVTRIRVGGGGLGDTAVGHIALASDTAAYGATLGALIGWAGETARARVVRIAGEQDLSLTVRGTGGDLVGPQRVATLLDLLGQAADVGGTLMEQREAVGLHFRARDSLYNEAASLALDYAAPGEVAPPLEPTGDDQGVTNDVEISRDDGASSRLVLDTGALSVLDPPGGIGRYDISDSLNLFTDGQTLDHAGWRLHLGTWDEDRYPTVHVDLAAAPSLIDAAVGVDTGDRLVISNPPVWCAPGSIDLLVQGYTETLGVYDWDVTYNCTPYGPYRVAVTDATDFGRADTEGSVLAAGATASATSLLVGTTSGPTWTEDAAQLPMDLAVGGEVVSVTAVSPAIADAFGRTVSNGWGTADTGQAWTTTGGSATDFSVGSGIGVHSVGSLNVSRNTTINPSAGADVDMAVSFSTSALATGSYQYAYLVGRWADSSNHYQARMQIGTAADMTLALRKQIAGVETQLAFVLLRLTHVAGTLYRMRLKVQGSVLYARAWLASGQEPSDWQLTATDTALTAAGPVGMRSLLNSANTNTLPVTFAYDDFRLLNPQMMTVTRSVNGISKAQTAGTSVALADPAIVAL